MTSDYWSSTAIWSGTMLSNPGLITIFETMTLCTTISLILSYFLLKDTKLVPMLITGSLTGVLFIFGLSLTVFRILFHQKAYQVAVANMTKSIQDNLLSKAKNIEDARMEFPLIYEEFEGERQKCCNEVFSRKIAKLCVKYRVMACSKINSFAELLYDTTSQSNFSMKKKLIAGDLAKPTIQDEIFIKMILRYSKDGFHGVENPRHKAKAILKKIKIANICSFIQCVTKTHGQLPNIESKVFAKVMSYDFSSLFSRASKCFLDIDDDYVGKAIRTFNDNLAYQELSKSLTLLCQKGDNTKKLAALLIEAALRTSQIQIEEQGPECEHDIHLISSNLLTCDKSRYNEIKNIFNCTKILCNDEHVEEYADSLFSAVMFYSMRWREKYHKAKEETHKHSDKEDNSKETLKGSYQPARKSPRYLFETTSGARVFNPVRDARKGDREKVMNI